MFSTKRAQCFLRHNIWIRNSVFVSSATHGHKSSFQKKFVGGKLSILNLMHTHQNTQTYPTMFVSTHYTTSNVHTHTIRTITYLIRTATHWHTSHLSVCFLPRDEEFIETWCERHGNMHDFTFSRLSDLSAASSNCFSYTSCLLILLTGSFFCSHCRFV